MWHELLYLKKAHIKRFLGKFTDFDKLRESPSGLALHVIPSSWYRFFIFRNAKTQTDNT